MYFFFFYFDRAVIWFIFTTIFSIYTIYIYTILTIIFFASIDAATINLFTSKITLKIGLGDTCL